MSKLGWRRLFDIAVDGSRLRRDIDALMMLLDVMHAFWPRVSWIDGVVFNDGRSCGWWCPFHVFYDDSDVEVLISIVLPSLPGINGWLSTMALCLG